MSARSLAAGFAVLVAAGWLASCGLVTPKQAWVKAGAFEGGDPVVFINQGQAHHQGRGRSGDRHRLDPAAPARRLPADPGPGCA